jgi:NADH dehydrogenase FAD-containing subunit
VQKAAMTGLSKLGVDIKLSAKVISTSPSTTGQTEVVYSDGSKVLTDLYVPTFGVVPNSAYIPSKLLNADGFAIVDEYLKVKGTNDIWAIGDVAYVEWAQWIYMERQGGHVAKNLVAILKGKFPTPYKPSNDGNRTYFLFFTSSYAHVLLFPNTSQHPPQPPKLKLLPQE